MLFWLCGPKGHLETAASDMHKSLPSFSSTDLSGLMHSEQTHQLEGNKDSLATLQICITSKLLRVKEGSISIPFTQSRGDEETKPWDAP